MFTPTETIDAVPSDPDDNHVLECAVVSGSETVLTEDLDLIRLGNYSKIKIKIQRLSDFLAKERAP
jgi:predicted nucleic acid-binding protein